MKWFQVSRRHRIVAKLPDGKTPHEALLDALHQHDSVIPPGEERDWVMSMSPSEAGDFYLRVYAEKDGNWQQLSPELFDKFRKAGGGTYSWLMR